MPHSRGWCGTARVVPPGRTYGAVDCDDLFARVRRNSVLRGSESCANPRILTCSRPRTTARRCLPRCRFKIGLLSPRWFGLARHHYEKALKRMQKRVTPEAMRLRHVWGTRVRGISNLNRPDCLGSLLIMKAPLPQSVSIFRCYLGSLGNSNANVARTPHGDA